MCVGTARRRRQDDVHVAQPFLCAWLVGTVRPDGQEAMVRVNCWQVQPEHSSGAVVKHGSRGASSAGLAAAEAAGEAGIKNLNIYNVIQSHLILGEQRM